MKGRYRHLAVVVAGVLVATGCADTKLDGLAREDRLRVHDYTLAACQLGLLEAARIAPAKPVPEGSGGAASARLERKVSSLDRLGAGVPTVIPAPFREQAQKHAHNYGYRLWRDRLTNDVAPFALADGCRDYAEAHFMTFRAYREYDANGQIAPAQQVSDADLVQVATERREGEAARQRRPDALAGPWGDVAGCGEGRRFVFADGELRMDPVGGKAGNPVEYLPMRLAIDEYRVRDAMIEVVAVSGETLQLGLPATDRLEIRPKSVLEGSVCSAISAAGVILRCPG